MIDLVYSKMIPERTNRNVNIDIMSPTSETVIFDGFFSLSCFLDFLSISLPPFLKLLSLLAKDIISLYLVLVKHFVVIFVLYKHFCLCYTVIVRR